MSNEPDSAGPDSALRAQIAERMRTMAEHQLPKLKFPLFQNSGEFDAVKPAEQFPKLDNLLARALEKVAIESPAETALNGLNPKQHDYNALVLELLTNLFEGYRALRYQTDLLTMALADLCEKMPEMQGNIAVALAESAARIERLEAGAESGGQ